MGFLAILHGATIWAMVFLIFATNNTSAIGKKFNDEQRRMLMWVELAVFVVLLFTRYY